MSAEKATGNCPVPDVLLAYRRGRLRRLERGEIRRHLRRCPACARDSRYVASVLRDESRLIGDIDKIFNPRRKTRFGPGRASWLIASAGAVAGMLLIVTGTMTQRDFSTAVPPKPLLAGFAEDSSGSILPAGLFAKRPDFRDQLIRAGVRLETEFDSPPYFPPGTESVLASFKISSKRDADESFYGWSLKVSPATDGVKLTNAPR